MQTFLPDNAPFTEAQRAWLNGFIAGLLGAERLKSELPTAATSGTAAQEEQFPWHDPTLALDERMKLATGRPLERQLMAAMGQLDCGQCGYLCRTYAEAIHSGTGPDLGKCVPGGRETAKKLKELIALRPALTASIAAPSAPRVLERGYGRDAPVSARLLASTALTASAIEESNPVTTAAPSSTRRTTGACCGSRSSWFASVPVRVTTSGICSRRASRSASGPAR